MSGQEYFEMVIASIAYTYGISLIYVYMGVMYRFLKMMQLTYKQQALNWAFISFLTGEAFFHREYFFIAPIEIELIIFSPFLVYGSVVTVSRYISKDLIFKDPEVVIEPQKVFPLEAPSAANIALLLIVNITSIALWGGTVVAYHEIIRPALKSMFVQ